MISPGAAAAVTKSDDDADLIGSADMHENLKRQGKAISMLRNKLGLMQVRWLWQVVRPFG